MIIRYRCMIVAYALLMMSAQESLAQRFMRTKTAQINNFVDITSEDALRNAIKEHPVVVIKAYSPNCPHCIKYEAAFNAAAQSLKDKAYFVAYNANNENLNKFSDKYDVDSLPTTLIFVNGDLKTKKIGGMSQDALATEINKVAIAKKVPSKQDIDDMDEDDSFDDMDIQEEVIIVKQLPASKPAAKRAPVKKEVVVKKEEHKPSCCQKKQAKPVCAKPQQKPEPKVEHHGGIKEIATQAEYDAVLGMPGLVVIKFSAPWCGPCQKMKPLYQKIAEKFAGKAVFVEIDVDKIDKNAEKEFEELSHVLAPSLPRLLFIKNGEKVDQLGNAPEHVLEAVIDKHLK